MGEIERALLTASCLRHATLRISGNGKKRGKRASSRGWGGNERSMGGVISFLFKRLKVEERHDSTGPLDTAALPVLNQSQRLQLMAKIRNNHRLPLIILN